MQVRVEGKHVGVEGKQGGWGVDKGCTTLYV